MILAATAMLVGEHSRSRLPAATLLYILAQRAEYSIKIADSALMPLASVVMEDAGQGWAQAQQLKVRHKYHVSEIFYTCCVHLIFRF